MYEQIIPNVYKATNYLVNFDWELHLVKRYYVGLIN